MKKEGIIGELDYLRGMSFLAVALQHTIGIYARKQDIPVIDAITLGILFNLVKFAVPSFVFITGMVVFYNYYQRKKIIYQEFILTRTKEILVPYILWSLIYIYYYHSVSLRDISFFIIGIVDKLITGTSAYHLWYVVLVFQFYLFLPVLIAVCRFVRLRFGNNSWVVAALAVFAYLLLMWLSYDNAWGNGHDNKLLQTIIKYRDRNLIMWIFYFYVGAYAALSINRWRDWVKKRYFQLFVAFIISWGVVNYELLSGLKGNIVNLNISTTFKPTMVVYSIIGVAIFYGLSMLMATNGDKPMSRLIRQFGRYSLPAYLVHALILNYSVFFILKFTFLTNLGYIFLTIVSFIMCVTLSLLLSVLLAKLPMGKYLAGSPR